MPITEKDMKTLIAQGEYAAEKTYAPVVKRFPEIFYRTSRAFRSPVFPFIKKTAVWLLFVCGASYVSATAPFFFTSS